MEQSVRKRVQKLSPLINCSPYFRCTEAAGCIQYTVYSHMYFPTDYGRDPAVEYEALTTRATIADVGSERQVEITGVDAMKLADYLIVKDLSGLSVGGCAYSFCCDDRGQLITDLVIMRIEESRIWLSGSDADLHLWIRGFALGGDWNTAVREPDCSPLQVQGPLSGEVLAPLTDRSFLDLKRMQCMETQVAGVDVVLARLGWSREYGFEIFPHSSEGGEELWNAILETGKPLGLMVTPPNYANAVESGITTYCLGANDGITPLSLWRPKSVDLRKHAFMGKQALERIAAEGGPDRLEIGLLGPQTPPALMERPWTIIASGETAGKVRQIVYSPRLKRTIGIAFVTRKYADPGTRVEVLSSDGEAIECQVANLPFVADRN